MKPVTTTNELYQHTREALRRLLALLDKPQPGLITWAQAMNEARHDVMGWLGDNHEI